jgi:hypothetical protein
MPASASRIEAASPEMPAPTTIARKPSGTSSGAGGSGPSPSSDHRPVLRRDLLAHRDAQHPHELLVGRCGQRRRLAVAPAPDRFHRGGPDLALDVLRQPAVGVVVEPPLTFRRVRLREPALVAGEHHQHRDQRRDVRGLHRPHEHHRRSPSSTISA